MADAEPERRASLAVIWQDLATPVRAILGHQEIILAEGQRLRLDDALPYLRQVLAAAGQLGDLVDRLAGAGAATAGDDNLPEARRTGRMSCQAS